jgi:hypothetical protein
MVANRPADRTEIAKALINFGYDNATIAEWAGVAESYVRALRSRMGLKLKRAA